MKFFQHHKKIVFIAGIFMFLFLGGNVKAANSGEVVNFNVDKNFDASNRTQITATLVKTAYNLYFYIDKSWWDYQPAEKRREILSYLDSLSGEFDSKIYPVLTSAFGSVWSPGVDNDSKITVLFEPMNSNEGGYFREADEYVKLQLPTSNEREMVYLALDRIDDPQLKVLLAHEFMHLITFNQKTKKYDAQEDTWLDEARAEYVSTLLGYDDNYANSVLEKRVQSFSEKPSGSLVDWQGTEYDYGRASLFIHYLVDQYGVDILFDSLNSLKTGIDSINYALQKNGFKEDFSKVFLDWTITVLINDCNYGARYCYLNKDLRNFYLSPSISFLPLSGITTLTFTDNTKYWSGNWYKLIGGGGGTLKFRFEGDPKVSFYVPYIKKDKSSGYVVGFMNLAKTQKGEFYIENFGRDVTSLFLIPVLQDGIKPPDNNFHSLFWSASITRPNSENNDEIQKLLAIIDDLKKQISALQGQQGGGGTQSQCSITGNLYIGLANNSQVRCLQQFLKSQGADIYPEGYITGNFGGLTKAAVIRFQEKYASDILAPVGLSAGSGYVGSQTRMKINQILSGG